MRVAVNVGGILFSSIYAAYKYGPVNEHMETHLVAAVNGMFVINDKGQVVQIVEAIPFFQFDRREN